MTTDVPIDSESTKPVFRNHPERNHRSLGYDAYDAFYALSSEVGHTAPPGVQCIEFIGDFRALLSIGTSVSAPVDRRLCDKRKSRRDSHLHRFGVSFF